MRLLFSSLLSICCALILNAQNNADSILKLKSELKSELTDSGSIALQFKIASLFDDKQQDSVLAYYDSAIALANKTDNDSLEAEGYYKKGHLFSRLNKPEEAIRNYQIARHIFDEAKLNSSLAKVYNIIGYNYLNVYAEDKAIEYYLKSLTIYSELNDEEGKAVNFIDIGNLYYDQENYDFARIYFEDALEIFEKLNDSSGVATSYINLGNTVADSGNVEDGLNYYEQSIAISEALDDYYGLAVNYNNMGDCFITNEDYPRAKEYFQKALQISTEEEEEGLMSIIYLNLADVSIKCKSFSDAIKYAKQSNEYAKSSGELDIMAENFLFIANAYEALGNKNNALSFLKQHQVAKDSLFDKDREKKVQLFNALNELEKSHYRIDELSVQNEIAQLKYENERKWTYMFILVTVVFAFLIVFMIIQQTSKKKAYNLLSHKNIQIEKMNEEIQQQRDDLNQLNKTKDKFFSIIAHDLKNPFNSIKGFTELMIENSQEYAEDKRLKFLKIIKESTTRASGLLNNLLIWANSQTGSIEFKPDKLGLKNTIANVISLLEIQAMNKDVNVIDESQTNVFLYADNNMVNTILRNLISNAIKFSHPGSSVKVTSSVENDFATISVLDFGVGMNQESIKNLFSVENKFSSVGTANEQGSGLGLILCKDFVEKHGGGITVSSEIDKGTEFRFSLPVWVES